MDPLCLSYLATRCIKLTKMAARKESEAARHQLYSMLKLWPKHGCHCDENKVGSSLSENSMWENVNLKNAMNKITCNEKAKLDGCCS